MTKRKKIVKNYGLKIDFPKEGDYILGGLSLLPKKILQSDGQWDEFLPVKELQALKVESFSCTAFGTLSACEILIKRLYGEEENFSDRWLSWNADIKPPGTSPHYMAEVLRKGGTPYQQYWDYTEDIDTWEKFYETPPPKLFDYAKENFLDIYDFKHEYVPLDIKSIKEALKYSPLAISVYAWIIKENEIYYRPVGAIDNHWVVCYGWLEKDGKFLLKIFDSYDNVLKLYNNLPMIAKRIYLEKKMKVKLSWLEIIRMFFGTID